MPDPLKTKARLKHAPNYRCAYCHEGVEAETQAPCPGCGTLLHAECKASVGSCPTLGCSHHTQPPTTLVSPRFSTLQRAELLSWLGMGTGAGGMVLSFLGLASGVTAIAAGGAAGFVAGAILLVAGLLAFSVVACRGGTSLVAGAERRASATIFARMSLAAGLGGMGLSFLALLSRHVQDLIAGGAGFLAGALLVLGGVVSTAILAAREAPRDDSQTPVDPPG